MGSANPQAAAKCVEIAKKHGLTGMKIACVTGKPKTETLKCSIGYRDGFIGDGEISYGGPGCLARAKTKAIADLVPNEMEI